MTKSRNLRTIAVDQANYMALKSLGKKGDSFNDIIGALLSGREDVNHQDKSYGQPSFLPDFGGK